MSDLAYACGEYDAQGNLIRATTRYPVGPMSAQEAADIVGAGAAAPHTVLIWDDPDIDPPALLSDAPPAQGQFRRYA